MVLFVPVLPLGDEHEFVLCGFCHRAFRTSILKQEIEIEDAEAVDFEDVQPNAAIPRPRPSARPDPELAGAAASSLLTWGS